MNQIDSNALEQLLNAQSQPAITMYIPMLTSAAPPHMSENQIRFKNLFHRAYEMLSQRQDGAGLTRQLRDFYKQHHNEPAFWEHQTPALLVCATAESVQMFQLPIDTEEYVALDDSFHLAPVISLVDDQRDFYVLALAQHDPVLYQGDMYGLRPADVHFPSDAHQALNIDEPNQQTENQGSATAPGSNSAGFNGRGGSRDPRDEDRQRFFRIINKIISANVDRKRPLILAGVDTEVTEFRELSTHPLILNASLSGNYKDVKPDNLFRAAYAVVWKELVVPEHQSAIEDYGRLHGAQPERTASDMKSVEKAANQGRVEKLLTSMTRQTTDTVQDNVASVSRLTFPDATTSQLMNALATKVYQMKGRVFNLLPDEMPQGKLMVAHLRY